MKQLFFWADKYSLGNDIIDEQHKKILGLINKLYYAFKQGNAHDILKNILDEMIDYTDYHFKTEENFFEKMNYSDIVTHKKEHALFLETVKQFYIELENENISLSFDVMIFLRDWWYEHILNSDKKYMKELL